MTSRSKPRKHHQPRRNEAVFDDLCSFFHIGALTVSDMLFDDSSVEVDEDDDVIATHTKRSMHHDDETLEDSATYFENKCHGGGDDGSDSVTIRMEIDNEDDDRAAEASECDNTLTDISAIVSSRLSCSPRFRRAGSRSSRTVVVSDDEGSESNILSMDTVPSLLDENDDDDDLADKGRKHDRTIAFHRSPSRKQRRSCNDHPESIPSFITPKRKNKNRGPYRLKQIVSKGVQRFNTFSCAASIAKGIRASSKPRAMFGATSQGQHDDVTETGTAYRLSAGKLDTLEEIVPFDEPLWYN
jgi:hypothetical protein